MEQLTGSTLRELAEIPPDAKTKEGATYPTLPDIPCPKETAFDYREPKPVFYGHYWRTGEPRKGRTGPTTRSVSTSVR